jgi:hypothetical protein
LPIGTSVQVYQLLDDYACRFSQKAKNRAIEELKKADQVQDESEADKHRAIAEVWKKVSADIMEENSRMKGRLADVFLREKVIFATRIGSLKLDEVFENLSGEEVKLKIEGTNLIVPATIIKEHKKVEVTNSMQKCLLVQRGPNTPGERVYSGCNRCCDLAVEKCMR